MRGIDNDWESTPKVRQSLLGYNRPSIINRPATEYPPRQFQYQTFFLDAGCKILGKDKPTSSSYAKYNAESRNDDGVSFVHTFNRYTELCGISKATLYMSTDEHDDMVSSRGRSHTFALLTLTGCICCHSKTRQEWRSFVAPEHPYERSP